MCVVDFSSFLASRMGLIKPSPTLALNAQANALKKAGHDIISLAVGEPDFNTPEHVVKAAIHALQSGDTKYTPVGGTAALKDAVIEKFRRDNQVLFTPAEVMASCGGKQILYQALHGLLNPLDEVLIPVPYWVSYPDMVRLAAAQPVFVVPKDKRTLSLTCEDLQAAYTPRCKVLILNTPSNPSSRVIAPEELKKIATWAIEKKLFIISDEIYEKLVYAPCSPWSMTSLFKDLKELRAQTLIAHGVAKTYSMTGWRIGYCAGPAWLIQAMSTLQGAITSNPTSFAQAGAVAALTGPQDVIETMCGVFFKRRQLLLSLIADIPGVYCVPIEGAFYGFIHVQNILDAGRCGATDQAMSQYLLTQHGVAVVPGTEFGMPGYIRVSFAMHESDIERAIMRLKTAFSK